MENTLCCHNVLVLQMSKHLHNPLKNRKNIISLISCLLESPIVYAWEDKG